MTTPIDSCRLYMHLRDLAHPDCGGGRRAPGARLIDIDRDHEAPNELGLSSGQVDAAIEELLETELVHRLTPQDELARGLDHPPGHHDRLLLSEIDDLAAATLLFAGT